MNIQLDHAQNTTSQIQNPKTLSSFAYNPAILAISNSGMVLEYNEVSEKILDIPQKYPYGIHISMLLPQLQDIHLLDKEREHVNPYLRFLSRIGKSFKIMSMRGKRFTGKLDFSEITFQNRHQIIMMIYPVRQENELYES